MTIRDGGCYDPRQHGRFDPSATDPGAHRVTVLQQFAHRDPAKAWTNRITGTVLEYMQKHTGSWFAHSKNDKLWLDRLKLRKRRRRADDAEPRRIQPHRDGGSPSPKAE